jgi:hypothetical protein
VAGRAWRGIDRDRVVETPGGHIVDGVVLDVLATLELVSEPAAQHAREVHRERASRQIPLHDPTEGVAGRVVQQLLDGAGVPAGP